MLDRPDVCDLGFEFIPDATSPTMGFIVLPPKELGLASKSTVHRASFLSGEVREIGEIPASAERRGVDSYVYIFQEGGSIYLNTYAVKKDRIELSPSSLELVIDGQVCTSPETNVRLMNSEGDTTCKGIASASFSNPICISHGIQGSRITDRAACRELDRTSSDK
jgi:hypothetical protein